jgi:hypothetical protein
VGRWVCLGLLFSGLSGCPSNVLPVLTPGQNVKRYLAGALDVRTGRIVWVEGHRKRRALFIELLEKLVEIYRDKRRIHVVLDNYCIHTSQITQKAVEGFGGRIVVMPADLREPMA